LLQRQELEALRVERDRAAALEKQVQDLAGDVQRETEAKALLREVGIFKSRLKLATECAIHNDFIGNDFRDDAIHNDFIGNDFRDDFRDDVSTCLPASSIDDLLLYVFFAMSFEKRPIRLRLENEIERHSKCDRL